MVNRYSKTIKRTFFNPSFYWDLEGFEGETYVSINEGDQKVVLSLSQFNEISESLADD